MSLLGLEQLYAFVSSRRFPLARLWGYLRLMAILCIVVTLMCNVRSTTNPRRASAARSKGDLPLPSRSPTRYRGLVPIVDREKYEEVEGRTKYHAQHDGGDPNFQEWDTPPNPFSPPQVKKIPEPRRPASIELWPDEKADSHFCPVHSGCRFLLPVWMGEQESKAIGHIQQLAFIARELNLTLVLPPMWKARFGTCFRNPFTYYYERDVFKSLGVTSMTFEAFQQWTSRRFSKPTSRIFNVLRSNAETKPSPDFEHVTISESMYISNGKRNHCLERKAPRIALASSATTIRPAMPEWFVDPSETAGFANDVVKVLGRETSNIISMVWELRHPIFPELADLHNIGYARRWTEMAESISRNISPFIAIHWRMETAPVDHMVACAEGLVSTINSISRGNLSATDADASKGAIAVYLATDYPLENPTAAAHSGTFRNLHENHHAAIRSLMHAFTSHGALAPLGLTSLAQEIKASEERHGMRMEDMDSGLKGILDKLIAMRSNWFVAGTKSCSRQR